MVAFSKTQTAVSYVKNIFMHLLEKLIHQFYLIIIFMISKMTIGI